MPDPKIAARLRFAARLQQLREAAGLSQYELAKRAGVTRQTLSRLEMGESEPAWSTVQALADVLGVPLEAFKADAEGQADAPPGEVTRKPGRPRKAAPELPAEKPAPKRSTNKGRKKG